VHYRPVPAGQATRSSCVGQGLDPIGPRPVATHCPKGRNDEVGPGYGRMEPRCRFARAPSAPPTHWALGISGSASTWSRARRARVVDRGNERSDPAKSTHRWNEQAGRQRTTPAGPEDPPGWLSHHLGSGRLWACAAEVSRLERSALAQSVAAADVSSPRPAVAKAT